MGNSGTKYTVDYDNKHYEGVGVEGLIDSVFKNVEDQYTGRIKEDFGAVRDSNNKYMERIVKSVKDFEQTLKNNQTPENQMAMKLVDKIKKEIAKQVTSKSTFGAMPSRHGGVLMFGNPTPAYVVSLSDMKGPVDHSAQAEFGRRKRRKSKKRVSFGKKRRGSKKKSRKTRRA